MAPRPKSPESGRTITRHTSPCDARRYWRAPKTSQSCPTTVEQLLGVAAEADVGRSGPSLINADLINAGQACPNLSMFAECGRVAQHLGRMLPSLTKIRSRHYSCRSHSRASESAQDHNNQGVAAACGFAAAKGIAAACGITTTYGSPPPVGSPLLMRSPRTMGSPPLMVSPQTKSHMGSPRRVGLPQPMMPPPPIWSRQARARRVRQNLIETAQIWPKSSQIQAKCGR